MATVALFSMMMGDFCVGFHENGDSLRWFFTRMGDFGVFFHEDGNCCVVFHEIFLRCFSTRREILALFLHEDGRLLRDFSRGRGVGCGVTGLHLRGNFVCLWNVRTCRV